MSNITTVASLTFVVGAIPRTGIPRSSRRSSRWRRSCTRRWLRWTSPRPGDSGTNNRTHPCHWVHFRSQVPVSFWDDVSTTMPVFCRASLCYLTNMPIHQAACTLYVDRLILSPHTLFLTVVPSFAWESLSLAFRFCPTRTFLKVDPVRGRARSDRHQGGAAEGRVCPEVHSCVVWLRLKRAASLL